MLDTFIQSLGQSCRVIDLSHALGPGIPVFPGFPDPRFESLYSQQAGMDANVETIQFVPHSGTHMDAPTISSRNCAGWMSCRLTA